MATSGWSPKDVSLPGTVVVGASATNTPVSKSFPIYAEGALNMQIAVDVSAVTGTVILKLQTAIGTTWVDSKTASVSGTGRAYIKLLATDSSDWTFLPLLAQGRVVATTDGGEAITVTAVNVLQAL